MLRFILSFRNALQPVNRLSPETISLIARCAMESHHEDATAIIPLTHVCRYWRDSIVSTPENWASISSQNEDMAVVSLERAKAAPLKISFNMFRDAKNRPSFPKIIIPYIQNTGTLEVYHIPSTEEFTNAFPNFPRSMPALRSLTLSPYIDIDIDWDESTDLFEGFVPALEFLSLEYIPLYPSLLGLRTLTEVIIQHPQFDLHLDTLLDFLEANHLLESATLEISFLESSLRTSKRRTAMKNQLRRLSIDSWKVVDIQTLVSSIPLRTGSHLTIGTTYRKIRLKETLPDISTAHLSNPQSPTFFELKNQKAFRSILLRGAGGTFSFQSDSTPEEPFEDFSELPLTKVREVRLLSFGTDSLVIPAFPLSSFPLLETLAVEQLGCGNILGIISSLLSNPSSSPALKTLAFLNCNLSEEFMEGLTKFASERQKTATSTWLYRVLIVHEDGIFPQAASIRRLRDYVKVVDAQMGNRLPRDLM